MAHVTSLTVLPLLSCSSATLPHPKRKLKLLLGNQFLPWHIWFPARYYRKLLPCFPNSFFTHLTWQKQHKPEKQKKGFPGHLMGVQTICRCLQSLSFSPASSSSAPGLPLLHPLVESNSSEQWWSPMLSAQWLHPLHHLHTCFHSNIQNTDHLVSLFSTSWFDKSFCQWNRQMIRKAPWHKPQAV